MNHKAKTYMLLSIIGFVLGCRHETIPVGKVIDTTYAALDTTSFIIQYKVGLSQDRILTVFSMSSPWLGNSLSNGAELEQSDGRKVDFDCDKIADKIIDANLVKEITPYCAVLSERGKKYWEDHDYTPDEYESHGIKWKRVR
jgi:hypothetical protein